MAHFRRSHSITDQRNYYPPDATLQAILGALSNKADTGEVVTKASALGQPSWYRGLKLIGNTVAKVPKPIFRHLDNDSRERVRDHQLWTLLNEQANPFTSSFSFFQAFGAELCYGEAYGLIERDEQFDAQALHNLDNRQVFPMWEFTDGRLTNVFYGVRTTEGILTFPSEDVLHVKDLALGDNTHAVDVVSSMHNNFALGSVLTKYACIYYKNGSHINKVLKVPQWLTPDQKNELKDELASGHIGINSAHKILTLYGGAEIDSLPSDNDSAQYNESARQSASDKGVILGVPGNLIGMKEGVSQYGNLHEENMSFLIHTIDAIFANIETELTRKLLRPSERKSGLYVEFTREAVTRGNPELEDQLKEKKFLSGRMSWEETRELDNLPTDRKGTFVLPSACQIWEADGSQHPEPPPPPEPPAPPQAQGEVPNEAQEAEKDLTRSEDHLEKSIRLTRSVLDRLKRRFTKSGQIDQEAVEEALEGLDTVKVMNSLTTYKDELAAVLPEQRHEVMEKWNTSTLAAELWN